MGHGPPFPSTDTVHWPLAVVGGTPTFLSSTRRVSLMLKLITKAQARLNSLRSDETGNAAEYGLIIGLVAVGIIVALIALAGGISSLFTEVGTRLTNING